MARRKKLLIGTAVSLSLLATAFQTSTAARIDDDLASAQQIRQVAAQIAACPELRKEVRELMDERFGLLTQVDIAAIAQDSQACEEHYRAVPEGASITLAYSALAQQFDLHPAAADTATR